MIPALIGNAKHNTAEKSKELLKMMGLGERMEHKPAELSGGETACCGCPCAYKRPCSGFADEPSGSLDTDNKAELHSLFLNFATS